MKTLLIIANLLWLTACSPNISNKIFSSENLLAPVSSGVSGDYGSAIVGSTFDDKIFVFSKGSTDSSGSNLTLISEDFAISTSSGCNKNLTKASDKCQVKVKFLKNKVVGDYSADLKVGSVGFETTISLTAQVTEVPSLENSPAGLNGFNVLEGTISKNLDGAFLDFGTLSYAQTLAKVITIKKYGPTPDLPVVSFGGIPSKYSVDKNYCTSPLKNGETCLVRITIAHNMTNLSSGNAMDEVLSVNGVDKTVATSYFNAYIPEPPKVANIKFYYNGLLISGSLDLGDLGSKSSEKIIVVKNEGDAAASGASVGLTTESSVFSLGTNACTSSLGIGKSCQFKVKANPGLTTGTHAASASYAGVGIVISGSTTGPQLVGPFMSISSWSCDRRSGAASPGPSFLCKDEDLVVDVSVRSDFIAQHANASVNLVVGQTCDTLMSPGDKFFYGPSSWGDFYLTPVTTHPVTGYSGGQHTIKISHDSWGASNGYQQGVLSYVLYQGSSSTFSSKVYDCLTIGNIQLRADCSVNQHEDENLNCVNNTRVCSSMPPYATAGSETYSNGSWGSCVVSACQSGYTVSGNSCQQQQSTDYRTENLLTEQEKSISSDDVTFYLWMNNSDEYFTGMGSAQGQAVIACNPYNSDYYYDVYIANDGDISNIMNSGMPNLWSGYCDTGGMNPSIINSPEVSRLGRVVYGEEMYVAIVRTYTGLGNPQDPEIVKVQPMGTKMYNTPPVFTSGRTFLMGNGNGTGLKGLFNFYSADMTMDPQYSAYSPDFSQLHRWLNCSFDLSGESTSCFLNYMMNEIEVNIHNTNMCGNYTVQGSLTLMAQSYVPDANYSSIPIEVSLPSCECGNRGMVEDSYGQCICPNNMSDMGGFCGCTETGTIDMGGYCGCDNSSGYYDTGSGSCEYIQCSNYSNSGDCSSSPRGCWWDEDSQMCY